MSTDPSEERGSVLVIVAFWLPVLILFTMFVLEVGNWYEHKRHLQLQADAAAFAGGDMFSACFGGAGNSAIFSEASKYAGATGTYAGTPYGSVLYNAQVGGSNQGTLSVLYQSTRWANGTVDPDPPQTSGPCSSPYMFDVKTTETQLPLFFAGIIPSLPFVPAINAQARVQLHAIASTHPTLPLGIPDVNPHAVALTFVYDSGANAGQPLAGCPNSFGLGACVFPLTGPTASNGLNNWGGTATIPVPSAAGTNVGIRVSIGSSAGTCADVNSGAGYFCYVYNTGGQASNVGVLRIRSYPTSGTGSTTTPILRDVSPSTCSGTPFFSTNSASGGSCAATLSANVDFGGTVDYSQAHVRASIRSTSGGSSTTIDLTHGSGTTWTASFGSLPTGNGPYDITMDWKYGSGKFTSFNSGNPVAQIFSAGDGSDSTTPAGPILAASVTTGSGGSASSLPAGSSQTIAVAIGLAPALHLATPCANGTSGATYSCTTDKPVLLRFQTSSSLTYAIDCGTPPGGSGGTLYQQIRYGCANSYSINTRDLCPDTASPPDCVPVQTGAAVGQVQSGMNDRFAPGGVCTPNTYPSRSSNDPRLVTLVVTDFSAFSGSGGSSASDVPVVNYATFYVTGWTGAPSGCNGMNEPPPSGASGNGNSADIWGHFVQNVIPGNGGPPVCDPNGLDPCTPVLTK